ncbi:tetratricopeptide repeat protein [Rhodoblastus acidophilus]|uniref:Tetratricopeptide repeat protein n=1 Tax=Candidatus Rhodoblastus alkanivorans TaxID=2954117 RepID=A0ABS9Z7K0_9HYPH|nr:tetratricopeptide repeat protein [Candidatus Rhodoblastus alkanivorans]MCI4678318.1 tetratricopeptide repeat protein [Candidatus Rhodoblastus alkanivorans]MCI4683576.1 tetratricopeptide repeat protein [Candidatus Rhodoblastus alkanivorans]MDI4640891.1 tetratricopeptide repeat protein [Rhodoblastus acidophilus]
MADIFREIEEDVRVDQLKRLWSKYSIVVVALAVAIVVGTAISVFIQHQKQMRDEKAGAAFDAAQALGDANKPEAAATAFDDIVRTAPRGYQALARLRAAEERAGIDRDAAVKGFDAIAADPAYDKLLRDVARLRAGMLRVDVADSAELDGRFGALLDTPFRHTAREMLGLAALKRGDFETAGKWFDQIVVDPAAPENLRQQVNAFLSLVRGGGKFTPPPAPKPATKPAAPAPTK